MNEIYFCSCFPLSHNDEVVRGTQNLHWLYYSKSTPILASLKQRRLLTEALPPEVLFSLTSQGVLRWFPPPWLLLLWLLFLMSCSSSFVFSPLISPLVQVTSATKDFSCPISSDNPDVCVSSSELPFPTLCPPR